MNFSAKISMLGLGCVFVLMINGCSAKGKLNPDLSSDRSNMVKAYLNEFSSTAFEGSTIQLAIEDVLRRLPSEVFMKIIDRRRPVLFTEVYDSGTAQFANSSEIIVTPDEPPAFQEGMTIIKLSSALNRAPQQAATGVIAHELAHRVLDHVRRGSVNCQAERESNQLIKSWGFLQEYEAASQHFGQDAAGGDVASCQP